MPRFNLLNPRYVTHEVSPRHGWAIIEVTNGPPFYYILLDVYGATTVDSGSYSLKLVRSVIHYKEN